MASTAAIGRILRFGAFELNVATGELRKCGLRIKLRPQAAKVLVLLAIRNAETVTRDQLKREIWGDTFFVSAVATTGNLPAFPNSSIAAGTAQIQASSSARNLSNLTAGQMTFWIDYSVKAGM